MGNRFGISAEFVGDGARVCQEVVAENGVVLAAERFMTWVFPAPTDGGTLLSAPGLSLFMR